MVYGAEAVLPSDMRHDSPRVAAYDEADNEKARQDAIDLLDEEHDLAAGCSEIYQQDCNTPDVTFHLCNSNSCHFRLCDMIFPP